MREVHGMSRAEADRVKYRCRLPASLDDLGGPVSGVVEPPLTVVWSGLRAFDLEDPFERMGLYRTVLAEGMRDDLCTVLDRGILLDLWPTLRTLVPRALRAVWEGAFEELRALSDVPPVRPPGRIPGQPRSVRLASGTG